MAQRFLAGAFEKVRRANENIEALERDVRSVTLNDCYVFYPQADMYCEQGVEMTVSEAIARGVTHIWGDLPPIDPGVVRVPVIVSELMGVYLRVIKPPPLIEWGSTIGSIVHDLRSALDQLVWELSILHQRSLPIPVELLPTSETLPRRSPWRNVQFPVAETSSVWYGQRTSMLRLIDQNLIPAFDLVQPYQRRKSYQRTWPWLLNELWNRDKHRAIATTATYGDLAAISFSPANDSISPEQLATEMEFRTVSLHGVGRYKDGMKVAQVVITRKNATFPETSHALNVEAHFRVGIKFKEAAPTYGKGVIPTLEWLSAHVEGFLKAFVQ